LGSRINPGSHGNCVHTRIYGHFSLPALQYPCFIIKICLTATVESPKCPSAGRNPAYQVLILTQCRNVSHHFLDQYWRYVRLVSIVSMNLDPRRSESHLRRVPGFMALLGLPIAACQDPPMRILQFLDPQS